MKSNTHTPGEWKAMFSEMLEQSWISANGKNIAHINGGPDDTTTLEEAKANAARIVKCVNNHDRLLQTLTDLLASYKLYVKKPDESEFVINAEAAIKEATE